MGSKWIAWKWFDCSEYFHILVYKLTKRVPSGGDFFVEICTYLKAICSLFCFLKKPLHSFSPVDADFTHSWAPKHWCVARYWAKHFTDIISSAPPQGLIWQILYINCVPALQIETWGGSLYLVQLQVCLLIPKTFSLSQDRFFSFHQFLMIICAFSIKPSLESLKKKGKSQYVWRHIDQFCILLRGKKMKIWNKVRFSCWNEEERLFVPNISQRFRLQQLRQDGTCTGRTPRDDVRLLSPAGKGQNRPPKTFHQFAQRAQVCWAPAPQVFAAPLR